MTRMTRSKYKRQRQKKLLFSELPVDVFVIVLLFCTLNFRRVLLLHRRVSRTQFIVWGHVTAYLGCHQMPFSQYRQDHIDHKEWLPEAKFPCFETNLLLESMTIFIWQEFLEVFGPDWCMGFLKLGFEDKTGGLKAQFFIWRKVDNPVLIEIRSVNTFRADYAQVFEISAAESVIRRIFFSSPALSIAGSLFAAMTDDEGMFYCLK